MINDGLNDYLTRQKRAAHRRAHLTGLVRSGTLAVTRDKKSMRIECERAVAEHLARGGRIQHITYGQATTLYAWQSPSDIQGG